MKKFVVYLLVIVLVVSLGFGIFYLVRDNEVISISSASIYKDAGESFSLDVTHTNKRSDVKVYSSDDDIVSVRYDQDNTQVLANANKGGVARINVRTTNAKFRNLWCDVIVGDGSIDTPFYISTAEQLAAIGMGAEITDAEGNPTGVYAGGEGYEKYHSNLCYKLVSSIDASTVNQGFWVPLQKFNGRFDGNGLTISNVYIDAAGYKTALKDKADTRFVTGGDAGIFASIENSGIVYNFKVDNFTAVGTYGNFGSIAGINRGTVERIEIKDAYLSANASSLGGIVGRNESTVKRTIVVDAEGNETENREKVVARLDRNSINFVAGESRSVDAQGNVTTNITGTTGIIGGVVGYNKGGVIVYSYAKGEIFFGDDSTAEITYGGVVGRNEAVTLDDLPINVDAGETKMQGASIKDCYASIETTLKATPNAQSVFGGAVGHNIDKKIENFEDTQDEIVNNYLIGVYYNKDAHNLAQDGITKNFKGIGKFTKDDMNVDFAEKETIVLGLANDENGMKNKEKFISHKTLELVFNEDGTSRGVVESDVLWQFETVWAISEDVNDGMPYLNYQLVYIPDDFETVGVPIVSEQLDDYYYDITIDYPVTILSGTDGIVRFKVGDYYQLDYSPKGIDITWASADANIVTVDEDGKLYGVNVGITTVTATTRSGSQAKVSVIVENIPYKIISPTSEIHLYETQTFDLSQIVVEPALRTGDEITYTIADTGVATRFNTTLTGVKEGETTLTIKVADSTLAIKVVVKAVPSVKLTASKTRIYDYYETLKTNNALNGVVTISDDSVDTLTYSATIKSGSHVVNVSMNGSTLNYSIIGIGNATVRVEIASPSTHVGKGWVDIYFTILDEQKVTLTVSPSNVIDDYYSTMKKNGTLTISNSDGAKLSYTAQSYDSSVVSITSISGNTISYNVKKVGNTSIRISVTTAHYSGYAYVSFIIRDKQTVAESVTISPKSTTIMVGGSAQFTAGGNPSQPLTWSVENPAVASIDQNGRVTGLSAGTTGVIVETASGMEARATLVVNASNIVDINVSPSAETMYVGDTLNLNVYGTNYSSVRYSSSNATVASVNQQGVVTASAVGSATITVHALDGNGTIKDTAYSYITVVNPVTVTLVPSTTIAYDGDTVTFTATASQGANITFVDYPTNATINGNVVTVVADASAVSELYVKVVATDGRTSATADAKVRVSLNTAYSPYIYNLRQLNAVRYSPDKTYYLAATINVGEWTPIDKFTGYFTALGNYYLYNIHVNTTGNAGLFGTIEGANIKNLTIKSSVFSGSNAGAIAGTSIDSNVKTCSVENSQITGSKNAGALIGESKSNTVMSNVYSYNNTVTAIKSNNVTAGGIVGKASATQIQTPTVSGGKAVVSSNGYAGGVAGYTFDSEVTSALITGSINIEVATNITDSYAGGIVGYTNGHGVSAVQAITINKCTVDSANVSAYHVGGIAGYMQSNSIQTLNFHTRNKGYRWQDLETSSGIEINICKTAVREGVIVTGVKAGGLIGKLQSGCVTDCYTRATIKGANDAKDTIYKGGFAAEVCIEDVNKFNNSGGVGRAGVIESCYAAVKFGGSGKAYAITASNVHNYNGLFGSKDGGNRNYGYVFNYVFDNDLDGSADYTPGNFGNGDDVKAKKSTSDMKKLDTYKDKNFDTTGTWVFVSGNYPTLKTER